MLGIGGASTTLASWTPRPHVDRALDLGTGCGVQALHLEGHADEVVVTDLSERALAFARFNAALDEADWDVRAGSMLDPVAGERFGLVVSNPPFVITPRSGAVPLFEYRDGGAAGDAVVRDLVRGVGDHLEPGGIAQFLGNWEVPRGSTWTERVGAWLDGTGLDAWVVQREVQDPAEYAETWARDGGHHPGTVDFNAMYAAWLDDFEARDVEAIGFGVVTLHRPRTDRAPFVDLMDVPWPVEAPMGPTVLAGLDARTWLAEHDDDEVLDIAWRCAPDVHEERHTMPGAPDPTAIVLRQGGGLRRHLSPHHGHRGLRVGVRRRADRPGRRGCRSPACSTSTATRCGPRSSPSCATPSRTASSARGPPAAVRTHIDQRGHSGTDTPSRPSVSTPRRSDAPPRRQGGEATCAGP